MNKKAIYWTIGGVAVSVLGYFIYKKVTKPVIYFGDVEEDDTTSTTTTTTTTTNNSGLPLKRGSKGEKVKQLQRFLVAEGYDIGTFGANRDGVDGDFGRRTEQAVIENQQPFSTFKSMYPTAVKGQVSADFFNANIRGRY
jgi:peptidoglycan hydrolase-like protein with peptidoglycan-binding domain